MFCGCRAAAPSAPRPARPGHRSSSGDRGKPPEEPGLRCAEPRHLGGRGIRGVRESVEAQRHGKESRCLDGRGQPKADPWLRDGGEEVRCDDIGGSQWQPGERRELRAASSSHTGPAACLTAAGAWSYQAAAFGEEWLEVTQ